MRDMTIAGLAREGGVGVETVRYYQRRGLLEVPGRGLDSGVRRYGAEDVRRLRFIRSAQAASMRMSSAISSRVKPAAWAERMKRRRRTSSAP